MEKTKISRTVRLTESAVMIAVATMLSFVPLAEMPFGGSVTAFSMVPIIIIAYRHGMPWGLFTGFVHGIIQLLIGMKVLAYATTFQAAAAIIMLDYLAAFAVLGLGGLFRKNVKAQGMALTAGATLACVARYIIHVIVGCTIWAGVSIPDADGLIFSLAYNAAYMLPETLITIVGVLLISSLLDFRRPTLGRAAVVQSQTVPVMILSLASKVVVAGAGIFVFLQIFTGVQTDEGYDAMALADVNWLLLAVVAVSASFVAMVLATLARNMNNKAKVVA